MKLKITGNKCEQAGSVLLVTLLTGMIIGMALASYLYLVSHQNLSTMRSLAWNGAVAVAEAGVEEALTQLQYNDLNHLSANGWTAQSNGWYTKQHYLDAVNYYDVAIKKVDPPVIVSTATVPTPVNPTAVFGMILGDIARSTTGGGVVKRRIQVNTTRKPLMPGAMVAKGQIDFSGGGVTTDGFDSGDANYSTLGKYDVTKNKASGDVATNLNTPGAIAAGNAIVKGRVSTGAGGTVVQQGSGSIGDLAWTSAPTTGIETGWFKDDAHYTVDNVQPPFTNNYSTPIGGIVGLTPYAYILDQSQNYMLSSISGNVLVTGKATLWVTDSVNFGSKDTIYIAPGASLTLYVSAPSATITGLVNADGYAQSFQYYGLPSNTAVAFKSNASYTGTVYAPQAVFTLGGGGNNDYDFVGACAVNSVKMNGHFHFHFDEALRRILWKGYKVAGWNEVDPSAALN